MPITDSIFVLAQSVTLVSWWKAILLLIPFGVWAFYVSSVLDKHAARFNLPREKYNTVHLVVGLCAFLLALLIPVGGIVGFILGFVALAGILAGDALFFMNKHNNDERVPENFRVKLADFSKFAEAKKAKQASKLAGKAELTIRSPDKSTVLVPNSDSPEFSVRVGAEKLYLDAMINRASQVELVPIAAGSYQAKMLVDGVSANGDTIPAADAAKVMDFWKSAAKLDLAERRKRLSGDVTVEQGASKKKVRITSVGTQQGMRVTLLFDPEEAVKRTMNELGLLEQQAKELRELADDRKGIVLLAAPADSGRTTTLYSVLKMHDAYTENVQTVETEPQAPIEGVKANAWQQTADGPEFATLVRSILRRDPNVLGVSELPDPQTAKEIVRADPERTRVYVSLRADNSFGAIQAWLKAVGDANDATKTLKGVVAQRLIRKLCTNCRVAYAPTPDMVKRLGLPADQVKQLFKRGGQVMVKDKSTTCPMCNGSGYFGQEGVFEINVLTDGDRELLKKLDLSGLKLELRKRKVPTLQQAALRKALDGTTSVEEVLRVTTEGAPAEKPAAPAAQPATPAPQKAPTKPPAKPASGPAKS